MQEIEFSILYWFQGIHNPVLDKIVTLITHLGDKGAIWIVFTILMLIICKDKKGGATAFIALCLSVLTVNIILKNAVARPRPMWIADELGYMYSHLVGIPDDYSFPSGHSSASFAFSVAILPYYKKQGIAACVLAALIAISRLYVFIHWPTDVLFGIIIGIIDGILAIYIMKWVQKRRAQKNSVA